MSTIEELEIELGKTETTPRRTTLVEKLANKGYRFNDVLGKPKSHFTKKKKRKRKKR